MGQIESHFTKQELKLLRKMENGNKDIQLYSGYNGKFLIKFGEITITTETVILFHIRQGKKICIGQIEGKSFKSNLLFNNPFSVFIDRRSDENIFLHINYGNYNVVHTTQDNSMKIDEVLLAFIEDKLNTHLLIFNGQLDQKFTELVTKKEDFKRFLRYFAVGYISRDFPNLLR